MVTTLSKLSHQGMPPQFPALCGLCKQEVEELPVNPGTAIASSDNIVERKSESLSGNSFDLVRITPRFRRNTFC